MVRWWKGRKNQQRLYQQEEAARGRAEVIAAEAEYNRAMEQLGPKETARILAEGDPLPKPTPIIGVFDADN